MSKAPDRDAGRRSNSGGGSAGSSNGVRAMPPPGQARKERERDQYDEQQPPPAPVLKGSEGIRQYMMPGSKGATKPAERPRDDGRSCEPNGYRDERPRGERPREERPREERPNATQKMAPRPEDNFDDDDLRIVSHHSPKRRRTDEGPYLPRNDLDRPQPRPSSTGGARDPRYAAQGGNDPRKDTKRNGSDDMPVDSFPSNKNRDRERERPRDRSRNRDPREDSDRADRASRAYGVESQKRGSPQRPQEQREPSGFSRPQVRSGNGSPPRAPPKERGSPAKTQILPQAAPLLHPNPNPKPARAPHIPQPQLFQQPPPPIQPMPAPQQPVAKVSPPIRNQYDDVPEPREPKQKKQLPEVPAGSESFVSAKHQFMTENKNKKPGGWEPTDENNAEPMGMGQNELAQPFKPTSKRFKPPLMGDAGNNESSGNKLASRLSSAAHGGKNGSGKQDGPPVDERLKNLEPRMIEAIEAEMVDTSQNTVTWDDIAGLEHAKQSINEAIILPMLRPDIFNGLRAPPKGVLLYGPPGTGKTLLAKCIARQCKTSFFSISSSSLTSKWIGEGEKMVKALFAVARVRQPAVIFVDELDSLLSSRTEGENDAARRMKTEFLIQFDGCATSEDDRVLVIGATNRPGELDDAARRRFRKKLYIPLPNKDARRRLLTNLLLKVPNSLSAADVETVCDKTEGYSGSDLDQTVREAALGPIRNLAFDQLATMDVNDLRAVNLSDFDEAITQIKASVSPKDLANYENFEKIFGSSSFR